jgi:hypothetical protein
MFDLNALDILNCRKMITEVPHFSKINIGTSGWNDDQIEDWIIANLKGRYYLLDQPYVSDDGKLKTARFVGFEDQKEITYFILACPYLRRN